MAKKKKKPHRHRNVNVRCQEDGCRLVYMTAYVTWEKSASSCPNCNGSKARIIEEVEE